MIRKLKFAVLLGLLGWTAYVVAEQVCQTRCYWIGNTQYCRTTCTEY